MLELKKLDKHDSRIVMPFTLAHPIAALPLWQLSGKRLNLLGLMVGTIVPDLAYFLALRPIESFSHTLLGALTQGVLEGLVLFGIVRYGLQFCGAIGCPRGISQ
jgi:hypothetical protein